MTEADPSYAEHDDGPWTVSEDGHLLYSDDFRHDVTLRILGDFYSDEQRARYAQNIVKKLNVPATSKGGA